MSVNCFEDLFEHAGHACIVQVYVDAGNNPVNASIECLECNSVLVSYDAYDPDEEFPVLSVTRADLEEAGAPDDATHEQMAEIVRRASDMEEFSDDFWNNLQQAAIGDYDA